MYIANKAGHSVMKWKIGDPSGTFIAGTPGVAGSNSTSLSDPNAVRLDLYGNLYVSEFNNHRIQMFSPNNSTGTTIAGTGVFGISTNQLNGPQGFTFDSQMNLYASDTANHRIQKFMIL
ncbi:unnamed protein product [Didymodactylos carnosus]|uniref:Uncharacterized protein n=2 Tax=Didymodactylos carnosus TaxID=1234261 RepID=A0A8S2QMM1_9BILA|nr:unnamed protein product [Didymodactylos carnosus]CAF4114722.1 unnamed protein product [Didymodactylos carnosus]